MMIEKLRGLDPVNNLQKTQKSANTEKVSDSDSVTLSSEAQKLSEIHLAIETAKAAPDIREEKVAEMIEKFKDPSYTDSVLDSLADKIMESFGI